MIFKKLATLALTGAVALTPMLAMANDDVSADANANASVNSGPKHSFFGNFGFGVKADVSSNDDRKAEKDGEKADKMGDHQNNGQDKMQKGENRGQNAVDARVSILRKLEARIGDMARLTADQKAAIVAEIDAQISALNDLKAKISGDTSTTTLIADLKTIRPDYRTFLLTMPRTAIIAAANRIMTITDELNTIGTKLQARITAAHDAGADVSVAQSAYADYQIKVADAKVQGQAALDLVVNLKADGGDAAVLAANNAALKSARTKLQAARADLRAAHKDLMTIIKEVKGKGSVNATTTAETH